MRIPAVVEPLEALLPDEAQRTARQRALLAVGELGQRRLAAARILVIGAGGLAAPIVQYLAASGVGRIDIVDDDVIERSNLARQVLFTVEHLGAAKASVLAKAARALAPAAILKGHVERVTATSLPALVARAKPDVVIDTTDDWPTRFAVADAAAAHRLPLVWGSVIGTDGQLTVFAPHLEGAPGLDDLVDRATAAEHPVSCADQGVLGPLCGLVGSMAASEAIKLVVGAGDVLIGRLAVVEALGGRVREVPFAPRNPGAAAVQTTSDTADGPPSPQGRIRLAELVARATDERAVILDVRQPAVPSLPWPPSTGALATLQNTPLVRAPLEQLGAGLEHGRLPGAIDEATLVVVDIVVGPRARHAAGMLRSAGLQRVVILDEGIAALTPSPLPEEHAHG